MVNTGMQVEVVRRAANRLREKPLSYSQSTYGSRSAGSPCGTITCLAGELVISSEEDEARGLAKLWKLIDFSLGGTDFPEIPVYAASILGVSIHNVLWLFAMTANNWPSPYRDRMLSTTSRQKRALIAADLLDAIADGKVDLVSPRVSIYL